MGGGWGLEGVTPNASKLFLAKRFSVTGNGGGEGGGTPLNRKKIHQVVFEGFPEEKLTFSSSHLLP